MDPSLISTEDLLAEFDAGDFGDDNSVSHVVVPSISAQAQYPR